MKNRQGPIEAEGPLSILALSGCPWARAACCLPLGDHLCNLTERSPLIFASPPGLLVETLICNGDIFYRLYIIILYYTYVCIHIYV